MTKFVLGDPSIASAGGHYLEYALRVLDAAHRRGLQIGLAVNCAFDGEVPNEIRLLRPFVHDIWGEAPARRKKPLGPPTAKDHKLFKLLTSRFGVAFLAAKDLSAVEYYGWQSGSVPLYTRWISRIQLVRRHVEAQIHQDRISGRLDELNDGELLLHEASVTASMCLKKPRQAPTTDAASSELTRVAFKATVAAQFAKSLHAIIRDFELTEEDHVFLPTMSWADLAGILSVLGQAPTHNIPNFHLLFRRNIFEGYADKWKEQGFNVHELSHLFARAAAKNVSSRVFCYTDTVPLTAQYESLGAGPFSPLPIPAPTIQRTKRRSSRAFRIAYLGDARREKGFQYLPELVSAVENATWQPNITFDVQCYLPEGHSPIDMLQTIEALKRLKGTHLDLHFGSLNATGYSRAIERADAVLIAYDRSCYAARSSGIFIEALCAGKPVIATAGTWMSGLADSMTHQRHLECSRACRKSKSISGDQIKWLSFSTRPQIRSSASNLVLSGADVRYTILKVPMGATHLMLRFDRHAGEVGTYIRVHAVNRGTAGETLNEVVRVLGGHETEKFSMTMQVLPAQNDFWLSFGNAYGANNNSLSGIEFVWLESPEPIEESVGGIYFNPDLEGGPITALTASVFELERNYSVYASSARYAQSLLSGLHNADNLVDSILHSYTTKSTLRSVKHVLG